MVNRAVCTHSKFLAYMNMRRNTVITLVIAAILLGYVIYRRTQVPVLPVCQDCSRTISQSSASTAAMQYEGQVTMPRQLDLGWSGFNVTCLDTALSIEELLNSTAHADHVEITYKMCCSINITPPVISCRNASRMLLIPRSNVETLYAAGKRTIDLSYIDADRSFVFMTAASANHYQESLEMVTGLQRHFSNRTIVYWDLGLTAQQAAEVRKFCGVVYKQLNFSMYPAHVRMLSTYAFKAVCILETLYEYSILWWVDSSIRFNADDLSPGLAMLRPRHGLVLFDDPGHPVWPATYPQTYDYIATDEKGLQHTISCMGGSFIFANTPEIFSGFFYWLYACALDERCFAPIDYPESCKFKGPTVFAHCHRFDQSIMTMLAANFWGFGSDHYRFMHPYFTVERSGGRADNVLRCTGA